MLLYLSLGSNLGARKSYIEQALRALEEHIGVLLKCSSLYETAPWGFNSEHGFLNAVALFETTLSPLHILDITQDIERRLGRTQKTTSDGYHDRTIDIDLLFCDNAIIAEPRLTLPHPLLEKRRFVLEPLAEIAPHLQHPISGLTVKEMLTTLNQPSIELLAEASASELEAINRLLPQLSSSAKALSAEALKALIASPHTFIYIIKDENHATQGMASLCLCTSPTGTKAWVEDVVVEKECRGRGYARALLQHLKQESKRLGVKSLNLTSRPERQAANALYRSEGFELRTTNVYRLRD
jgi:2-amino-4-hydroxy-6-hydroxymethyldihydropteridine diphosphokinase